MAVNLYTILVKKDAYTIAPTTVPEYEIPLLQHIAGEENVTNVDGKLIDKFGEGDPVSTFDADDEVNRLYAKYGRELIAAVYGPDKSALEDKIKKAAITKTTRKAAATSA